MQTDAHKLSGKTALITGASSGFGAHFARILAQAGAHIIICARRAERIEALRDELVEQGHRVLAVEFDVNNTQAIPSLFDKAEAAQMPVDILINNAGMNHLENIFDISPEDFRTIIDTNMNAPFFLSREAAKRMIARNSSGRIINIGSVGSTEVLPGLTAYCMSKAGIAMLTRSLARELARYDINVNCLCPGYIETEINDFWWTTKGGQKQMKSFPRQRLGQKSDLDASLLMLAGEGGKGINGSLIRVDDGQYI